MIPPNQPPQGLVDQAAPGAAAPMPPQGQAPMPPQGQAPAGGPPPQGLVPQPSAEGPVDTTETEMTPEEDEAMASAIAMASELLYGDDKAHDTIMDGLTKGDPIETISDLTLFVVDQIEQQFQGKFPEGAVVPAADEISDMILELGETKGIFKVDEKMWQAAKGQMMSDLFEAYGIEEADLEGLMQGVTSDEVATMQKTFGGEQA